MSVLALFAYIVITALLGYLAIWVMGKLAPNHPPIIDQGVWVIVVLIIVFWVLTAFGLLNSGPMVPRLGGR